MVDEKSSAMEFSCALDAATHTLLLGMGKNGDISGRRAFQRCLAA
jgi:hypothetical protein